MVCTLAIDDGLSINLEKFWQIEECSDAPIPSKNETFCEQNFVLTTERDATGRFSVTLPIVQGSGTFGNSINNATKRLYAMERKFPRIHDFKILYNEFMREYELLGHMTKLDIEQRDSIDFAHIFYLPHHAVLNESSSTTKLRVVFDGSCKSENGVSLKSLNDHLLVGPMIQEDLFSILVRF